MGPLVARHYFRGFAGCHFPDSELDLSLLDCAGPIAGGPVTGKQFCKTGGRDSPRISTCVAERHHLLRRLMLLGLSRDGLVWRIERASGYWRPDPLLLVRWTGARPVRGVAGVYCIARMGCPGPAGRTLPLGWGGTFSSA